MPADKIGGTIQNDLLKEYVARGTYIYPPRQSMRIITDIFAYCGEHVPRWNTISISGYHIREAGTTAVQEIAFTLANAHRVRAGRGRRRARRRRLRAAALVLLERAQQLLRRGREVPRRPPHVVLDHEQPLRRAEREVEAAAVPHPDRRARRSPRSSRRTTSSASRCRRWPRCSAARRASTPTASTRRSACPPSARRKIALRTQQIVALRDGHDRHASTRSPARTSSSRSPTRSRPRPGEYIEQIDDLGGAVAAIEAGYHAGRDRAGRVRVGEGGRRRREGHRRRSTSSPIRRRWSPRCSRSTRSSSASRPQRLRTLRGQARPGRRRRGARRRAGRGEGHAEPAATR